MEPERFFCRLDRRYRLMRAREGFSRVLLVAGAVGCIMAIIDHLTGGVAGTVVATAAGLACGLTAAAQQYRRPRPHDAPLYYDRLVEGGERFPALHELVVTGRRGMVYEALAAECAARVRTVRFPFLAGAGRFFPLPYLAAVMVLAMPGGSVPIQAGGHSSPVIPVSRAAEQLTGTSGDVADGTGPLPWNVGVSIGTPAAGSGPDAGSGPETPAGTPACAQDGSGARALLEALAAHGADSSAFAAAVANAVAAIREGQADVLHSIGRLAVAAGGGGTGGGAGLFDPVHNALASGDFERAAAEFKSYLRRLGTPEHATELTLVMRAAAAGMAPATGTPRPGEGPPADAQGASASVSAGPQMPARWQTLVRQYLAIRAEEAGR